MHWQSLDNFLTRQRRYREPLCLVLDVALVLLAWQATYLFRLGFERWLSARPSYDPWLAGGIAVLYGGVLLALKVPKGMWRFSGFGEVKRIALACVIAGSIGASAVQMAELRAIPRAVLALHPVFCLFGMAMLRLGYRMLYEHMRARLNGSANERHRALVMGAGDAARLLLAGIQHQGWVVVGLLDDDPRKQDLRLGGVPVLGGLADVQALADLHGVTDVIVAMPSAATESRRRALELATSTGRHVLTVPNGAELRAGRSLEQLRDLEPEDLLGREPVKLDEAGLAGAISGRTVLVTGAGGSIGSELCRQLATYGPRRLVLFELSEFALYRIEQELSERFPHLPVIRLVGDVKDLELLRQVFARWRPQLVFHAAAYKHVPLMEEHNAWQALRNNTLGTFHAGLAAAESGVERFVLISTDKAVNPTNVMGASKRAAELVVSQLARDHAMTRFMAVRFGNVLGSSGSVIPKFKEQIAKGGPVTVTHPEITRYFMTIPEAARLVVQAGVMGESGQVLVLDMGEPVRIVDMARTLIRLSGHRDDEIAIEFTGLRPGEKLFEELLADGDTTLRTPIDRILLAKLQPSPLGGGSILNWLCRPELSRPMTDEQVRQSLIEVLPEARLDCGGVHE